MVFETDPVCKMQVLPETAAAKCEYEGRTYYFCATRCMERFKANPQQFLTPASSKSEVRNPKSPTPVPCTPTFASSVPDRVLSAAWLLNRKLPQPTTNRIPNSPT